MKTFLIAASALLMAAPAAAQSYDAFTSFNGTQGAGGFSYGQVGATGMDATLFTATTNCFIDQSVCLQSAANHDVPGVTKSTSPSFQYGTVDVPTDRLLLHPASNSDLTYAAFQAPAAGDYVISGLFNVQDRFPTGVAVSTFQSSAAGFALTPLPLISGATPTGSYSQRVMLTSGQLVGFAFGNAGFYGNDSIGFNFRVTAVPEPATWGMMILGFGAMGVAMRRRTKGRVASAIA